MEKDYNQFDKHKNNTSNDTRCSDKRIYDERYREAHPIAIPFLTRLNFANYDPEEEHEANVPNFGANYHHKELKLTRKFDGII